MSIQFSVPTSDSYRKVLKYRYSKIDLQKANKSNDLKTVSHISS